MQKLEVKPPVVLKAMEPRYCPGQMGYDLEQYLLANDIDQIGTMDKAVRYAAEDKLLGIDLTYERRCWRTWYIKTMLNTHGTREKLAAWHANELRRWEFLDFFMVRDKLGLFKNDETQVKFDDHFLAVLHDYNKSHMPPNRKYLHFSVPAYFYYDVEFDGMAFHHAHDFCVFEGEPLNMARFARGKAGSLERELE